MQSSNVLSAEIIQSFTLSTIALVVGLIVLILLFWRVVWHERPPKFAVNYLLVLWAAPLIIAVPVYALTLAPAQTARGGVEVEFWACGVELQPMHILNTEVDVAPLWSQNPFESGKQWTLHRPTSKPTVQSLVQGIGGDIQQDSVIIPLDERPQSWLTPASLQDGDPQGSLNSIDLERYIKARGNNATASFSTGQACPGSNTPQELQIFVLRSTSATTYTQEKITNPEEYLLHPSRRTPPADCVIVEFGEPKSRTDKLCPSYGVVDSKRCASFGARNVSPDNCPLVQVQKRDEQ